MIVSFNFVCSKIKAYRRRLIAFRFKKKKIFSAFLSFIRTKRTTVMSTELETVFSNTANTINYCYFLPTILK